MKRLLEKARLAAERAIAEHATRDGFGQNAVEDALDLVESALIRWAEADLRNYEILDIEKEFLHEGLCLKGVADLVLRVRHDARDAVLREHAGELVVVDWKTTANHLDARWKEYHALSWQWRYYAAAMGARIFLYRGISFYRTPQGQNETREFGFVVPDGNYDQVERQLRGLLTQIDALREISPWPRAMDYSACHAFGRDCEFLSLCRSGDPGPSTIPEKFLYLTYTKTRLFHVCPERFRLTVLTEEDAASDEALAVGKLFHYGIQAAYEIFRQGESE